MLLLILFATTGCKKNGIDTPAPDPNNKVLTFLEGQKAADGRLHFNANANIDLLKANLDLGTATTEQLDNERNLLLVPIKDAVINKKGLDKNSTLTLFLITDKSGKIRSGSIVYFQPTDGQKHNTIPQNTFSNLFRGKPVTLDGVYKMLTLTGKWLSQFKIKDGKILSTGVIQSKNKETTSSNRENQCIDWYLVTTYHYVDGSSSQDEEYLGTTCDDCSGDPSVYMSLCNDGGGGGGGDNTPPDSTSDHHVDDCVTSDWQDVVGMDPTGTDLFSVFSIHVTWHAEVSWEEYPRLGIIYGISTGTPYPVPPSTVFLDEDGNLATVVVSLGNWSSKVIRLTLGSALVQWTFVSIWDWDYSWGPRRHTFDDGISKVIGY